MVFNILSYPIINSSDFHPPISLPDKRMEENTTIRKLVGHPTSRQGEAYHIGEKKRTANNR